MEEEFRAVLTGAAAVTALVPAARINWGAHPQGAGWPAIVLNLVGGLDGAHMQGRNGLFEGRVQVDCYALDYAVAKSVARAAQAALHTYRGGGLQLVLQVATRDSREGGTNEADRPWRCSLDFTAAWRDPDG